jgi:hypothetical protein
MRLDTTGSVIDREEFYPYGDSSLRTFTKKRYRYTGKEKDAESGEAPWAVLIGDASQSGGFYPIAWYPAKN